MAGIAFSVPSPAQGRDSLAGVWAAKREFGPAVRGRLEITRGVSNWRAQISQYDENAVVANDQVSFKLPADQGKFVGRFGSDSVIRGHWIVWLTASPVILRRKGKDQWRGEVIPFPDEFTLYMVFYRKPDGSLGAFIRNPERNFGLLWTIDRVQQDGNHIKLVGKFRGRGEESVLGEGNYYPDDNRISMYFPARAATFDFVPASDDPTPGFYARGKNAPPYEYRPPVADDDGWKVGTLEEVGMVSEPLAELVRTISETPTSVHDVDIHGILVARHGKLVAEEYFHGFHRFKPHETRSASKSVAAILVGAAIQAGAKLTPSTRVYDLLYKGAAPAGMDPRKKAMTVEHLLTMSSGYDCDDDADPPRPGSEDVMTDEQPDSDYYHFTLNLPMALRPGEEAVYCSINANLLGAVLTAATNKPLVELFADLVAGPLQVRRYHLPLQPTGEPYLGGGMKWLPRDFMKLGQLMLDGGVWNGKRILSNEFTVRASSPLVSLRGVKDMRFGYLWWTINYPYRGKTVRGYFASGNGGQEVLVIPELDLVVAAYGGNYADRAGWFMIRDYVPKFILPALKDESR